MDTRPIGPKPKPGRPGGPKPKPGKPTPRPFPKPGKPGIGKPKPKPGKKPGLTVLDLLDVSKRKKKKNQNGKAVKAIGYAMTGIQNRLKGGKKGPGKVGKLAR